MGGHQWQSRHQRSSRDATVDGWPSVAITTSEVITYLMKEVIRGHQRSSEVIRGHQRSSEVITYLCDDACVKAACNGHTFIPQLGRKAPCWCARHGAAHHSTAHHGAARARGGHARGGARVEACMQPPRLAKQPCVRRYIWAGVQRRPALATAREFRQHPEVRDRASLGDTQHDEQAHLQPGRCMEIEGDTGRYREIPHESKRTCNQGGTRGRTQGRNQGGTRG
jgi:hypothetical protein